MPRIRVDYAGPISGVGPIGPTGPQGGTGPIGATGATGATGSGGATPRYTATDSYSYLLWTLDETASPHLNTGSYGTLNMVAGGTGFIEGYVGLFG